jgi:NAD(P)H dehydrogenase (quinone)
MVTVMSDLFPIVVTGASGKLGQLILSELIDRRGRPQDIIATSRNPDTLAWWSGRGVVTRAADFDRPGSELARAFAGAARALIISTTPEAPYVKGKRFRQQSAAIDAALAAGVPHIFYTSAPNPEPPNPAIWKEDHYRTEEYLKASGATWTILRHWEWPDWHLEENWLPALRTGVYATGAGTGRIAHITREDTAAADAGALISHDVANRTIDLTGPESLNADAIIALLSNLTGIPIRVDHLAPHAIAPHLLAQGANPLFVPIFEMIAEAIRLGKFDRVTPDAAALAGRPLTSLRGFLEQALQQLNDPVRIAGKT